MISKQSYIFCDKLNSNVPPYETVNFRIVDINSNTSVVEFKLTIEEFTSLLLSGSTFKSVDVKYNLDKLGKVINETNLIFEIPNEHERKIDTYLSEEYEKYRNEGWIFSTNDIGRKEYMIEEKENSKVYKIKAIKWE